MQQCKQPVMEKSAEGYAMLAQDEAGVRLGACGGYGRRFRGPMGAEVGVEFPTKETRIIGALGPDAVHAKVVDSINADTFIGFLKELRRHTKSSSCSLTTFLCTRLPRCPGTSSPLMEILFWRTCPSTPRSLTPWRSSGRYSRTCLPNEASGMPGNLPSQSGFWQILASSDLSSRWITRFRDRGFLRRRGVVQIFNSKSTKSLKITDLALA